MPHAIEIVALLIAEFRLRQKMVHAEHAGKRQADFMTHRGKQPRLFRLGLFGAQAGIFPFGKCKPLLSHISAMLLM